MQGSLPSRSGTGSWDSPSAPLPAVTGCLASTAAAIHSAEATWQQLRSDLPDLSHLSVRPDMSWHAHRSSQQAAISSRLGSCGQRDDAWHRDALRLANSPSASSGQQLDEGGVKKSTAQARSMSCQWWLARACTRAAWQMLMLSSAKGSSEI